MSDRRTGRKRRSLNGDYYLDDVHDHRVDRTTFTIFLSGEPAHAGSAMGREGVPEPGVEFLMADRFQRNLHILSGINSKRPILVEMASCGGDWDAGMQIFSGILFCPNPVTVLATKWARSMTSLIPLAADRFVIRPPAKYMYHRGSYGFSGLDQEADTENTERLKSGELMYRIYTARLKEQGKFRKWKRRRIRTMLESKTRDEINVWLSAEEAVKWGFADTVDDGNPETLRAKVKNKTRVESLRRVLSQPINVEVKVT